MNEPKLSSQKIIIRPYALSDYINLHEIYTQAGFFDPETDKRKRNKS